MIGVIKSFDTEIVLC